MKQKIFISCYPTDARPLVPSTAVVPTLQHVTLVSHNTATAKQQPLLLGIIPLCELDTSTMKMGVCSSYYD